MALALGMTVREVLERHSSAELAEWMAYYRFDPFGGERGDLQAATVAHAAASAWRSGDAEPLTISHFLIPYGRDPDDEDDQAETQQVEDLDGDTMDAGDLLKLWTDQERLFFGHDCKNVGDDLGQCGGVRSWDQ